MPISVMLSFVNSQFLATSYRHFMCHLEAEHTEMRSKELRKVFAETPYELIEILRVLESRRIFRGDCPVCKDW